MIDRLILCCFVSNNQVAGGATNLECTHLLTESDELAVAASTEKADLGLAVELLLDSALLPDEPSELLDGSCRFKTPGIPRCATQSPPMQSTMSR